MIKSINLMAYKAPIESIFLALKLNYTSLIEKAYFDNNIIREKEILSHSKILIFSLFKKLVSFKNTFFKVEKEKFILSFSRSGM